MIKLKVREKSLLHSKIKKKQTKQWQAALEQTIARLEKEIDHRKNTDLQNLPLEEQLNERIISQIKVKENNFVTSDKEILTECVSF